MLETGLAVCRLVEVLLTAMPERYSVALMIHIWLAVFAYAFRMLDRTLFDSAAVEGRNHARDYKHLGLCWPEVNSSKASVERIDDLRLRTRNRHCCWDSYGVVVYRV